MLTVHAQQLLVCLSDILSVFAVCVCLILPFESVQVRRQRYAGRRRERFSPASFFPSEKVKDQRKERAKTHSHAMHQNPERSGYRKRIKKITAFGNGRKAGAA